MRNHRSHDRNRGVLWRHRARARGIGAGTDCPTGTVRVRIWGSSVLVYACVDDMCVFSIFYVYACTRAGTHVPVVCDREIQSSIRRRTAVWMTRRLASDEVIHSFAQGGGTHRRVTRRVNRHRRSVGRSVARSRAAVGRRRPDLDAECRHVDGWWASRRLVRCMRERARVRETTTTRRCRAHTHTRARRLA